MLVLPAIDLKNGKAVRLVQGRADRETIYSDDPVQVALGFERAGAVMLHLVDLDGALGTGTDAGSANTAVIRALRSAVRLPLELGGGLRSVDDIARVLDLGVESVIVGTLAVRRPVAVEQALARFGGSRVQLAVDARSGKVAIQGWLEDTPRDAVEFALEWKACGIERAVYTDIARDGMLQGPNLEAIRAFAQGTGLRVTASGGVSRAQDVRSLAALEPIGVDRIIVGKALYEGTLKLDEVL